MIKPKPSALVSLNTNGRTDIFSDQLEFLRPKGIYMTLGSEILRNFRMKLSLFNTEGSLEIADESMNGIVYSFGGIYCLGAVAIVNRVW